MCYTGWQGCDRIYNEDPRGGHHYVMDFGPPYMEDDATNKNFAFMRSMNYKHTLEVHSRKPKAGNGYRDAPVCNAAEPKGTNIMHYSGQKK